MLHVSSFGVYQILYLKQNVFFTCCFNFDLSRAGCLLFVMLPNSLSLLFLLSLGGLVLPVGLTHEFLFFESLTLPELFFFNIKSFNTLTTTPILGYKKRPWWVELN